MIFHCLNSNIVNHRWQVVCVRDTWNSVWVPILSCSIECDWVAVEVIWSDENGRIFTAHGISYNWIFNWYYFDGITRCLICRTTVTVSSAQTWCGPIRFYAICLLYRRKIGWKVWHHWYRVIFTLIFALGLSLITKPLCLTLHSYFPPCNFVVANVIRWTTVNGVKHHQVCWRHTHNHNYCTHL